MFIDEIAKSEQEKIKLFNSYLEVFYKNVVSVKPCNDIHENKIYKIKFIDERTKNQNSCSFNDFEVFGNCDLTSCGYMSMVMHWGEFVSSKIEDKEQKAKYLKEYKKYHINKIEKQKQEVENLQF